ncbi:hypothetical protein N3930_45955, partial [Bacillus thuringiensis]|nr:hypothetical protein [Bacillus thuringiensis]
MSSDRKCAMHSIAFRLLVLISGFIVLLSGNSGMPAWADPGSDSAGQTTKATVNQQDQSLDTTAQQAIQGVLGGGGDAGSN